MGKTRDLFNKIRDTKWTYHANIGTVKGRNGIDLTEAEDIKKRWQEYTELYKKDLHNPDNHDGTITHLEPDILECKVKWASENITMNKASGGDEIPVELFQILKIILWKCCTQYASKFWKLSSGQEIQPIHPKGNQSWTFSGRTDAEAETPILWPPDVKYWLIGKDPDAGKDWRWEEKQMTENEMVGWHHRLNGRELE